MDEDGEALLEAEPAEVYRPPTISEVPTRGTFAVLSPEERPRYLRARSGN